MQAFRCGNRRSLIEMSSYGRSGFLIAAMAVQERSCCGDIEKSSVGRDSGEGDGFLKLQMSKYQV